MTSSIGFRPTLKPFSLLMGLSIWNGQKESFEMGLLLTNALRLFHTQC